VDFSLLGLETRFHEMEACQKMSLLILDLEQNLIHSYRNRIKFIQTQNRTETEIKERFGQDIYLPESGTIAKVLRLCHQPYYV
jgi:hypothetical protein